VVCSCLVTDHNGHRPPSHGVCFCPEGTNENSPAFQRRVACANNRVPQGRLKLTLNAPYSSCHANNRCSGKVSCTHFDEPPLISCSALEIAIVDGSESKMWTWSSTPPISMAFISFCRAMPPRNGQSLSRSTGVMSRHRSLVLKTQ